MTQYKLEYLNADIAVEGNRALIFVTFEDAMMKVACDLMSAHSPDMVYINWSDTTEGVWEADFVTHDVQADEYSHLGMDRARITRII